MIRNLFFDLDGTLLDTAPGIMWALRKSLEALSLPDMNDAELGRFIGPPLFESYEQYCGLRGEENARAVRIYQHYFNTQGGKEMVSCYPGMTALLETLSAAELADGSRKYRLFVATTKPEGIARQVLSDVGYAKYFSFIGGAMADNKGSQKVDVIKRVLRESGLIAEPVAEGEVPYVTEAAKQVIAESLMIGDRFYDIRGAHYLGMQAAAVRWGFGSETEFKEWQAEYILSEPEALLHVLD